MDVEQAVIPSLALQLVEPSVVSECRESRCTAVHLLKSVCQSSRTGGSAQVQTHLILLGAQCNVLVYTAFSQFHIHCRCCFQWCYVHICINKMYRSTEVYVHVPPSVYIKTDKHNYAYLSCHKSNSSCFISLPVMVHCSTLVGNASPRICVICSTLGILYHGRKHVLQKKKKKRLLCKNELWCMS